MFFALFFTDFLHIETIIEIYHWVLYYWIAPYRVIQLTQFLSFIEINFDYYKIHKINVEIRRKTETSLIIIHLIVCDLNHTEVKLERKKPVDSNRLILHAMITSWSVVVVQYKIWVRESFCLPAYSIEPNETPEQTRKCKLDLTCAHNFPNITRSLYTLAHPRTDSRNKTISTKR